MGWTAIERRLRDHLCWAMVPGAGELPPLSTLDTDTFWRSWERAAAPALSIGMRAAVWAASLSPPLAIGRFKTFARLSETDRQRTLRALANSPFFAVRQLPTMLKMMACFAYLHQEQLATRARLDGGRVAAEERTRAAVCELSRPALARLMSAGYPIEEGALDNREYRGISLGLPAMVEELSWKKFKKVFYRDSQRGLLRGWNVRMEQNGLGKPWIAKRRPDGEPKTFGHYVVRPAADYAMPGIAAGRGLMIDYGEGGNARGDPMSLMRDPLVALNPGSAELLLGCSYLELGPLQIATPSFFLLERDSVLSHRVDPPSGSEARQGGRGSRFARRDAS